MLPPLGRIELLLQRWGLLFLSSRLGIGLHVLAKTVQVNEVCIIPRGYGGVLRRCGGGKGGTPVGKGIHMLALPELPVPFAITPHHVHEVV